MDDFKSRTIQVLGEDALKRLEVSRVAVFGIGGVGGHAAEALARAGVGALDLIDSDRVELSNVNRQIVALRSTVGMFKTEVMAKRIADINPACRVETRNLLYLPETAAQFDFTDYDYIVDAVDNVTAKIDLVLRANESGTPIICSMGAGNKLHPELFRVADLFQTTVDPLAKVMRRELRARGVQHLQVVYSTEQPVVSGRTPGSVSFVPGAVGLILAGVVVRELTS